jgi:hypothetical protein
VLSNTLRLFHPFLPSSLRNCGTASVTIRNPRQGGNTIMTARWPKPLGDTSIHYGLAKAMNVRNE